MDGNNQILPLAWAIVPTESAEEWAFFLKHFKASFPTVNHLSIVIISDQGKGLDSTVPIYLPLATYCHCTQQICSNLMEKFHPGGEVKELFWKLVYISSEALFETYLKQIEVINTAAGQYLRGILTGMWA